MSTETTRQPVLSRPAWLSPRAVLPVARKAATGLVVGVRRGYWAEFGLIAALLLSLSIARMSLETWVTPDYTTFLSNWFAYLQLHGFRGLGDEFANYNVPYLYLMYIGTQFTSDAMLTVKTIGAVSDFALSLGCVALLLQLRLPKELAVVSGAAVLLLPEVLLNSAAWGQADATYTSVLVWAVWAVVRGHIRVSWALFAIAFTFKLQAAFVLPAFVVLQVVRRSTWQGPVIGVLAGLVMYVPALVAGRSPASLASVYFEQVNSGATLSMNAPSLYALLPEGRHDLLASSGMYFALGCVTLLTYLVLRAARRRALDSSTIILFVSALAMLAPYTLPMMHERYFYVGNVLLFVYALKHRQMLPWAFVAQAVAILAYTPFLFEYQPVIPMQGLALIQAALIFIVVRQLIRVTGAFGALDVEQEQQRERHAAISA